MKEPEPLTLEVDFASTAYQGVRAVRDPCLLFCPLLLPPTAFPCSESHPSNRVSQCCKGRFCEGTVIMKLCTSCSSNTSRRAALRVSSVVAWSCHYLMVSNSSLRSSDCAGSALAGSGGGGAAASLLATRTGL